MVASGPAIGLLRDRRDQIDHIANPQRRLRQFVDAGVGDLRLVDGFGGDPVRILVAAATDLTFDEAS